MVGDSMVKVMYHGKEIEISDKLQKGELELYTMDGFIKDKKSNLEDFSNTKEIKINNDTIKIKPINLDDTLQMNIIGDENE